MGCKQSDRTWPVPTRPWAMAMCWHDLLFAHWPVAQEELRPLVPAALDIDTFDGKAWLGVVPFSMTGVHPRRVPNLPGLSRFAELNVRTYVTAEGKPGVWFFSLDAANRIAVWVARRTFHLPYFNARISAVRDSDGWVHYECTRTDRSGPPARFRGSYRPTGEVYRAAQGTIDFWLTARYCLYSVDTCGRVYRGEIDHPPWPLQVAEAEFTESSMAQPLGITLPGTAPLLHFSKRIDTRAWTVRRIGQD